MRIGLPRGKGLLLLGLFLALLLWRAVPEPGRPSESPSEIRSGVVRDGARYLTLQTREFSLIPPEFQVGVGDRVRLTVINRGVQTHRVALEQLVAKDVRLLELPGAVWDEYLSSLSQQAERGIPEVLVTPGDWSIVEFTVPNPGTFRIACQLPDHANGGMVAQLVVGVVA